MSPTAENRSNLHPPAPVAAPLSSPRRAREDLGPQHQRRPEAAPAVLEAELAGVLELAEELVGDVPGHHLHHAAAASLGGVRAVVGRRQAHEVQERWWRRHGLSWSGGQEECMGGKKMDGWMDG